MDTAAVAIPIPVQPIEPPQPAPGSSLPDEAGDASPADFASALAQQLLQGAATAARPARLDAATTEDAPADTADAPDAAGATAPDALIAVLPAAMPAAAPQPAPGEARPGAAPERAAMAATGERGERTARSEAGPDAMEAEAPKTREFPAHNPERKGAGPELEAQPSTMPHRVDGLVAAHGNPLVHAPAPASAHVAAVDAAPAGPAVAARVGTAAWGDGLAQQVTLMVRDGEQTAQLRLDPPELGPLEVRLSMARGEDGVAHAQFASPHAAVREALEAALPQLRAVLADNGITLGQASVGEGYAREDARHAQQPAPGAGHAGGEAARNAPPAPRVAVRHGLVDTFA